jgi:methionyl-tRNA formyltransferase
MSLNILFAGTPAFAAMHLLALLESEHNVVAVYTQPDRPAGRGKKLQASAVKQLALEHAIPVMQPGSLKAQEDQQTLANFGADIMVVVAYGLILPKAVLGTPKFGCINVHASILPRWRGAAPIQRAIEAGDQETGVTIMQMDVGLDTGDMLHVSRCPIGLQNSSELHDTLANLGKPALLETLADIEHGKTGPQKQDESLACYAAKIEKSEALINWNENADTITRKIRAFNPFPIAYTMLGEQRLKIHAAQVIENTSENTEIGKIFVENDEINVLCARGSLRIDTLQLPGKKAMSSRDYLNGIGHTLAHSHLGEQ